MSSHFSLCVSVCMPDKLHVLVFISVTVSSAVSSQVWILQQWEPALSWCPVLDGRIPPLPVCLLFWVKPAKPSTNQTANLKPSVNKLCKPNGCFTKQDYQLTPKSGGLEIFLSNFLSCSFWFTTWAALFVCLNLILILFFCLKYLHTFAGRGGFKCDY